MTFTFFAQKLADLRRAKRGDGWLVDIQQYLRRIKAEMEDQAQETDRILKGKVIKLRNEK